MKNGKFILNQLSTGQRCETEIKSLKNSLEKLEGQSYMQYISVHAFSLALVLDYLTELEAKYNAILTSVNTIDRTKKFANIEK